MAKLIPISNRLFSPYVQTEIGRRQGGKGSGLGLALVRQIVKLSNGRLGVESEVGKGSMFWFELPYSLPHPPKLRSTEVSDASLQSPPMAQIVEHGYDTHRPNFNMTESTMPLIPSAHGQARLSSSKCIWRFAPRFCR